MNETPICKNCGKTVTGNYCSNCGEKRFDHYDRSILRVLEEGFHFITHFDGTIITTVKTMFKSPGKYASDYCIGIRKKYFKPLSFFLLIIVLYLIFPYFQGLNMKLQYYLTNVFYGKYATKQIAGLLPAYANPHALAEDFHHRAEKISKFLLFILIPLFAACSYVMIIKKKRFYYDHFIFCTELLSFFLLWGFLIFPFFVWLFLSIFPVDEIPEWVTGGIIYMSVAAYATIASSRFFHLKRWQSLLYGLAAAFLLNFILQVIYKFILFSITVWMM